MRWLVTGGCGFIGSALVRALAREGAAVRVVDDLSVGSAATLGATSEVDRVDARASVAAPRWCAGRVQLLVSDVRDRTAAQRAVEGAEVIVHLAASTGVQQSVDDPARDLSVNVLGTLSYLDAARLASVRRFVFASSGAPVGDREPPLHEEVPCRPASPYGASKLACEGYCSAYFHSFGLETVALRFGNVYGPGSAHKGSVVARFIGRALRGRPLEIYGDGGNTRDYVYVDDLVEAIRAAGTTANVGGEVFQIATERETTVRELVALLRKTLVRYGVPRAELVCRGPRVGDVRRNYSDTTKARRRLGWRARTPLPDGLDRTVRWFVERGVRESQAGAAAVGAPDP